MKIFKLFVSSRLSWCLNVDMGFGPCAGNDLSNWSYWSFILIYTILPQVNSKSQDMDNLSDMEAHGQSKGWTSFLRVQ